MPTNVDNSHWILIAAFPNTKEVRCYDSMGHANTVMTDKALTYLRLEHQRRYHNPLPSTWTARYGDSSVPQQGNSYDCGIFVSARGKDIVKNRSPTFDQPQMARFRASMQNRLLRHYRERQAMYEQNNADEE